MIIYSLKSLEESTKDKTIDYISDLFIKHIYVGLVIAKKKKVCVTKSNNQQVREKRTLFSKESKRKFYSL